MKSYSNVLDPLDVVNLEYLQGVMGADLSLKKLGTLSLSLTLTDNSVVPIEGIPKWILINSNKKRSTRKK